MGWKSAFGRFHMVTRHHLGEVDAEVFAAICALFQARTCCVVGGWAADFWVGRRTRDHADIDVLMAGGKSEQVAAFWLRRGASQVRVRDSGKVDVIFQQQRVALFPAAAMKSGTEEPSDRTILQDCKWVRLDDLEAPIIDRDHLLAILRDRKAYARNNGISDWKAEHDFSILVDSWVAPYF